MELGLLAAVIGLGVIHGVLPDHGWPIAATYALSFDAKWFRGTVAALILGVGHLISSIALVLAYFWISAFADFAEGPYMKPLAGGLLILLGIYEYASGGHGGHHHDHDDGHAHEHGHGDDDHLHGHGDNHHEHGHDEDHSHGHDDEHGDGNHRHENGHDHSHNPGHHHEESNHHNESSYAHAHDHEAVHEQTEAGSAGGWLARLRGLLPGGGHAHLSEKHAEEGLMTLGVTALLLGFAHEEPVQILAICAGTEFCLELMLVYSFAVIGAILAPTLLLIAGYEHYRERIEQFTPYLPTLTAVVLVLVGLWFVLSGIL